VEIYVHGKERQKENKLYGIQREREIAWEREGERGRERDREREREGEVEKDRATAIKRRNRRDGKKAGVGLTESDSL
jgi:hypothetical protein